MRIKSEREREKEREAESPEQNVQEEAHMYGTAIHQGYKHKSNFQENSLRKFGLNSLEIYLIKHK